jgi:hypothetical protein
MTSRLEYMFEPEDQPAPKLPLVRVIPDNGHWFGWRVIVGAVDMGLYRTRWSAERAARRFREDVKAFEERAR